MEIEGVRQRIRSQDGDMCAEVGDDVIVGATWVVESSDEIWPAGIVNNHLIFHHSSGFLLEDVSPGSVECGVVWKSEVEIHEEIDAGIFESVGPSGLVIWTTLTNLNAGLS